MPISEKLKTYLHGGNGMVMGTRDASMKPEFQRVLGAIVVDESHLKIFLDGKTAGRIFENLSDNQMIAVATCSFTFESYQFKGKSIRWAESTAEELEIIEEYFRNFSVSMKDFGLGEDFVFKYPHSQMVTLLMEVTDIFEQTPKTGTGQKIN
jgi:hypothetical protein